MSRSQENKKEKNYNAWPLRDSVQDTPTFLFFFFFGFVDILSNLHYMVFIQKPEGTETFIL